MSTGGGHEPRAEAIACPPADVALRKVLIRNISVWGPLARKYVLEEAHTFDVIGFLETHAVGETNLEIVDTMVRAGFKPVVAPARPYKDVEKAGGVVVAVRGQHQASSFRHLAMRPDQLVGIAAGGSFTPGPVDFWDFAPIAWRLKSRNLIVVPVYLTASIGIARANKDKLAIIGGFLSALRDLWILIGDFNVPPQELERSGWLEEVGGVCIVPSNSDYTCYLGPGRLIDYAVVPKGSEVFFRNLLALEDARWQAHLGLVLTVDAEPLANLQWSLQLPAPLPHPPLPKKSPDPASKRSRRKLALMALRSDDENQREQWRIAEKKKVISARKKAADAQRVGKPPPQALCFAQEAREGLLAYDDPEADFEPFEPEEEDPWAEGPPDWDREDDETLEVAALSEDSVPSVTIRLTNSDEPPAAIRLTNAQLDRLWDDTSSQLLRGANPPSYVRTSAAFTLASEQSLCLGRSYASWATRMENFYLTLYDVHPQGRQKFQGRAQLRELKLVTKSNPVAALTTHEDDAWWSATAVNIALLLRMRKGKASPERVAAQTAKIQARAGSTPSARAPLLTPADVANWNRTLKSLHLLTDIEIAAARDAAQHNRDLCARACAKTSMQQFVAWFDKAAEGGAGALHRASKPRIAVVDEAFVGTASCLEGTTSNQVDFMDAKREAWASRWCHEGQHSEALLSKVQQFRDAAAEVDMSPITEHLLDSALSNEPDTRDKGLVQVSPKDVARLPSKGKKQLLDLLHDCERNATWPWQFLAVAVALIPKKGGDRGIGILPWLTRLWARIRSDGLSDWIDQTADPWDDAVKGSSALRHALRRAFLDESADALQVHTASALWDVKEFFDSLDLLKIIRAAEEYDFPPTEMVLLFIEHMAPRLLRVRGAYALPISPHRSAVAGCRGAQQFARILLKKVLYHVHSRFSPLVISKAWIDDVNQRAEGPRKVVVRALTDAGASFAAGVTSLDLVIADKSRIIGSELSMSEEIACNLVAAGYPVKAAPSAPDLGVDRGSGIARSKPVSNERFAASLRRTRKGTRLVKAAKRPAVGKKLFVTGVIPQGAYHAKIFGMAPTRIAQIRRAGGATVSHSQRGRCLTTRLSIEMGDDDPAISIPASTIAAWIDFLVTFPDELGRAVRAWKPIRRSLSKRKHKWRGIKGPISAVICTLCDAGWNPKTPNCWVDPEGREWTFPVEPVHANIPPDFTLLKEAFAESRRLAVWKKAAKFCDGEGLEKGPDLQGLKRHLQYYKRTGQHERRGALIAVATASPWTRTRIHEVNADFDPICKRCNRQVPETPWHRYWDCPGNDAIPACKKTQHLYNKAKLGVDKLPCLWLRGMLPRSWTAVEAQPPAQASVKEELLGIDATRRSLHGTTSEPVWACGDGSGGEKSSDQRLRRAAWAWVQVEPDSNPAALKLWRDARDAVYYEGNWDTSAPLLHRARSAPVTGSRQTVNRAETLAFLDCLVTTAGDLHFVTDSAYVVKNFAKLRRGKVPTKDLDLWAAVAAAASGRFVALHKVESHLQTDSPDFDSGRYPPLWILGNAWADFFADEAAAEAAVPSGQASAVDWTDAVARGVRNRLVAVLLDVIDKDPHVRSPPKPAHTRKRRAAQVKAAELAAARRDTQHTLSAEGAPISCTRCGAAPAMTRPLEWYRTACVPPDAAPFCPEFAVPLSSAPIVIKGATIHPSHVPVYHSNMSLWICSTCGAASTQFLRDLAAPCQTRKKSGAENLERVSRGLVPGKSASARAHNDDRLGDRARRVRKPSLKLPPAKPTLRRLARKQPPPPEYASDDSPTTREAAGQPSRVQNFPTARGAAEQPFQPLDLPSCAAEEAAPQTEAVAALLAAASAPAREVSESFWSEQRRLRVPEVPRAVSASSRCGLPPPPGTRPVTPDLAGAAAAAAAITTMERHASLEWEMSAAGIGEPMPPSEDEPLAIPLAVQTSAASADDAWAKKLAATGFEANFTLSEEEQESSCSGVEVAIEADPEAVTILEEDPARHAPPQPSAEDLANETAIPENPGDLAALQLELDALRDLLELDSMGARVAFPPNLGPTAARSRVQFLEDFLKRS